ncbi:DUF2207 domain-containing protein [Scatolibacter rhodanostii]|uniref:DUF2207 domain-containing protein n=1 Tax=Scatolibacter rhodanostii TaxID=2014781 RepID=UPI000C06D442|nr:DUF2207 domain-containing protein [Scatolibacter rhodanostii]
MKYKKMKKAFFVTLFIMLFVMSAVPAFAEEDGIPSIKVDVNLNSDGSAVITEIWDIHNVYDGTEYYKAIENTETMQVHSLRVWDESGIEYQNLANWNTKLTREEKQGKSGILKTKKGYELCWGIGDYGNRQYTIQYTIDGLVKNYGDYAGFYHQFISDLSSTPESGSVQLQMENTVLSAGNARIWGYGYEGEVKIGNNGTLIAFSNGEVEALNLLCRFDKNLFPTAMRADISFEELHDQAEDENSDLPAIILISALVGGFSIFVGLMAFFTSRHKLSDGTVVRIPSEKKIESNSIVPFGGNIPVVFALMKMLRRDISLQNSMSAYLIRWQKEGYIKMEESEKVSGSGKIKKEDAIIFIAHKEPIQPIEQSLYTILKKKANADGILWSSAIEKFAEKLYKKLEKWTEEVGQLGEDELIHRNIAVKNEKGKLLFTASGFDQAVRLLGFQKYLKEIRNPTEDRNVPRELWGDYLIFAILFGIGEKTLKAFKALDPAYFDTFSGYYGCNPYQMIYMMNMINHFSSSAAPDMGGTGGSSSISAGGGFSGGGGGGSR